MLGMFFIVNGGICNLMSSADLKCVGVECWMLNGDDDGADCGCVKVTVEILLGKLYTLSIK